METQMLTTGPICMSHFIARDVACIAIAIYPMVMMRKFGPVFCISVYFEKGIMKLTLQLHLRPGTCGIDYDLCT